MTADLVAFLRQRLDEEEAAARDLLKPYAWGYSVFYEASAEELAHIERYRPARVLADVQAKRQIIQAWRDACDNPYREMRQAGHMEGLEEAMTLLVNAFSNHPDFDEAWRVSADAGGEHQT